MEAGSAAGVILTPAALGRVSSLDGWKAARPTTSGRTGGALQPLAGTEPSRTLLSRLVVAVGTSQRLSLPLPRMAATAARRSEDNAEPKEGLSMRTWMRFFFAAWVAVLAACGGGDDGEPINGPVLGSSPDLVGQAAPDFTLMSSSGEEVRLAALRGSVVMLNFWASWCGPCRMEMPLLDAMYQRYHRAGFMLFGVNVEEDSTDAKKVLQELGLTFPILFDPESTAGRLFGIDAMPTTVLIDKKGQIRYVNRGYKSGDENKYRDQIRELIRD